MKKNAQQNKLIGHFEKLGKVMASRYDIKVVASDKCATDGRTIFFPANADRFKEASKKVLHGMFDHELGHIEEEDRH